MNDRSNYSLNGVYRCENLVELIRLNNLPRVPLGPLGGIGGWYLKLRVKTNRTIIYPFISCDGKPDLVLRFFFNIIKEDGSSAYETVDKCTIKAGSGPKGLDMNIQKLLNDDNGYLDDDGTLTVEYGIHVDAILRDDGIWQFNLNDQFFNSENALEIEYGPEDRPVDAFYGHKQLLRFYSPHFQNEVSEFFPSTMEKWQYEECLQMAHGVRIQLKTFLWAYYILWVADWNQLKNVVHNVDLQLIQIFATAEKELPFLEVFESCIGLGLRHTCAQLVDHFKCLEDLKKILRQLNIQKMSGEAMKTFAAKIFDLGT